MTLTALTSLNIVRLISPEEKKFQKNSFVQIPLFHTREDQFFLEEIVKIKSLINQFFIQIATQMNQQNSQKIGRVCNQILKSKPDEQEFGNLYLGALGSLDPEVISEHKISAVLTIMDNYMYDKKNVKERIENLHIQQSKWVDLRDDDQADIAKHFEQCYSFIQNCLLQHNVLVHCQAGISRSATIVIFYVMKKLNLPLDLANKLVASKRWHISPNQNFWKSLKQKEQELQSTTEKNESKIKDPASEFRTEKYPQKFANHIVCLNSEATPEKGNLFLGQYSILKSHFLKSLQIKSVISVVQQSYYKRMKVKQILQHEGIENHLWLNVKDEPNQNLALFFQQCFEFINQNLQIGNVLVHCQAGVSRSASVVIAYLIKKFKVNFSEALNFVQSKRKVVNPNEGFKLSLIQYSEKLAFE